jgi:hypothetical protein
MTPPDTAHQLTVRHLENDHGFTPSDDPFHAHELAHLGDLTLTPAGTRRHTHPSGGTSPIQLRD